MGEAKRRGTKADRVASAIERQRLEDEAERQGKLLALENEKERIRNLPPEIRKAVMMRRRSSKHMALTALAVAALAFPSPRK